MLPDLVSGRAVLCSCARLPAPPPLYATKLSRPVHTSEHLGIAQTNGIRWFEKLDLDEAIASLDHRNIDSERGKVFVKLYTHF